MTRMWTGLLVVLPALALAAEEPALPPAPPPAPPPAASPPPSVSAPAPPPLPASPAPAAPHSTAPPIPTPELGVRPKEAPLKLSAEMGKGIVAKAGELFSLSIRSRIQAQFFLSRPSVGAVARGSHDQLTDGFLIRRLRLVFAGHAFTPKLQYYIQLGFSNRDMERDLLIPLRDAYITWQLLRDFGLRFGQMKVPFGKQRVVSSSALQMVDRSIVTGELNLDRDVGLYAQSEDFLGLGGRLQYQAGFFSGLGRNRAPSINSLLYFGRIQINPFGNFEHLSESDHLRLPKPRLSLGFTAAHNVNTNRTLSTFSDVYSFARFSYLHLGGDLHFKWAGFSLLSEILYRRADKDSVVDEKSGKREHSRSALGYFVQAGYLLRFPIELVARWGEIFPAAGTDPNFLRQREVGGALNFYLWEHSLKLQGDYFYLFGEDRDVGTHQVRVQAQLFF